MLTTATRARYALHPPGGVLARYAIKAWDPGAHPRDPRTGRFIRNPAAGGGRPRRRGRTINNHSASATTRKAIARAQKTLPADRDGWRLHVVNRTRPAERRVDRQMALAQQKLADARAAVAQARATLQEEFRRDRTPKDQQEAIKLRRLDPFLSRVDNAERDVAQLQEIADSKNTTSLQIQYMHQVVPPLEVPNYPKDPNGKLMPPDAYNKALDAVLDVGKQLHDDFLDSVQRDRRHKEIRQQLVDGEYSTANVTAASKAGNRDEAKRLADGRARLLRDKAEREQQLLLELLGSVRPVGGKVKALAAGDAEQQRYNAGPARADWQERLRVTERVYPSDWLRLSSEKPLHIGSSRRAFHNGLNDKSESLLAMSTPDMDDVPYTGGFADQTDEVTVHEMGHRMEMLVPGLKELEFTFIRRRSTGPDGRLEATRKLNELTGSNAHRDHEVAYPDEWKRPYAGRTYEARNEADPAIQSWEVFQVGLQDTLGRGNVRYGDEQLQQFTLGVLATLARGD